MKALRTMTAFLQRTQNDVCTECYFVSFWILTQTGLEQNEKQFLTVQFCRATFALQNVLFTYLFYCIENWWRIIFEKGGLPKMQVFDKSHFTRKVASRKKPATFWCFEISIRLIAHLVENWTLYKGASLNLF